MDALESYSTLSDICFELAVRAYDDDDLHLAYMYALECEKLVSKYKALRFAEGQTDIVIKTILLS